MPRIRKPPFPFADDEVVIARDGFICEVDGREVVVRHKTRLRSSNPVVIAHPEMFVPDGEEPAPADRPDPPEPPPLPAPPTVTLRAKKSYTGHSGDVAVVITKGDIVSFRRGSPPFAIAVMSAALRKEIFEEIGPDDV